MPTYRVYELAYGQIVSGPHDVEAADGFHAVVKAKKLYRGRHIEIWKDRRRIVTIPAVSNASVAQHRS